LNNLPDQFANTEITLSLTGKLLHPVNGLRGSPWTGSDFNALVVRGEF